MSAQDLSTLTASDVETGQRLFEARCARCHGIEGGGGEGPALARPYLRYARDDQTLASVLRNGIPGTAMPASPWLSDLEVRQIAAYVRELGRVAVPEEPLPGDSARGEQLYLVEGGCGACHGSQGRGTRFGPELVGVGSRRNAEFIRRSIADPGAELPTGLSDAMGSTFADYLPVSVESDRRGSVRGHRVSETSFVIVVRDSEGKLHAFEKTEVERLVKQFGQSLMPSYRGVFTDEELDDLVAYLLSLGEAAP